MKVRERTAVLDADQLAEALLPRSSVVEEVEESSGVFTSIDGPVRSYRRTVVSEPTADGRFQVTQRVEVDIAIPYWGWLFGPPLRSFLSKIGGPSEEAPIWFPPDRMDARASTTLARIGVLAFVLGYGATLLTQIITYAAEEFGANKGAQGIALAAVRADVLIALPLTFLADRRGRRRLVVQGSVIACAITAVGAIAPNLWALTGAQVVARGLINACILTLGVMVAEEMPAGARAWATSIISSAGFAGAGLCLFMLPFADLSSGAWRALFLVPLALIPLAMRAGSGLEETHRFVAHVEQRSERVSPFRVLRDHRNRFLLLAASGLLISIFATPASQFQNEFLRNERGFSGLEITLFVAITGAPGAIGIILGGRLAERGRRLVGAVATFVGVGGTLAMYYTSGVGLYAWSAAASLVGAAAVPALGVYGAELFPTEARGAANGGLGLATRIGSVIGLIVAGQLGDSIGLPRALTYLAIGPLLLTFLILAAYPETAHMELEDLNPEDAPIPD